MTDAEDHGPVELVATGLAWRALADDWRLSEKERRELFPGGGAGDAVPPADTLARMRVLVEIGYRLRFESVAALHDWLRRPMLLFALDAPLDVMSGGFDDLLRFRGLVERGLGS